MTFTQQKHQKAAIQLTLTGLCLLAPLLCVLLIAGCKGTNNSGSSVVTQTAMDPNFAGNEACLPCHEREYKAHHNSFHDTSLRPANVAGLGPAKPPTGIVPLAGYAIDSKGEGFELRRGEGNSAEKRQLDYAMGSGKLGVTYVSISADQLMETRMSYFPPYKLWEKTPGQEVHTESDRPFGREHPATEGRMCLGCHTTALPVQGLQIAQGFFGVGCESCHGPAKAHIAAAKAGNADLKMENLGKRPPSKLNELCGKCHRTANAVDLDTPEVNLTHRFQPYALQRSRCRTRDNEPLSCTFCHDPHQNVSNEKPPYERVCKSCHGGALEGINAAAKAAVRLTKPCPVNPGNNCIACHMRPKTVFPLTSVPAKMADHLISPPGAGESRKNPTLGPAVNTFK